MTREVPIDRLDSLGASRRGRGSPLDSRAEAILPTRRHPATRAVPILEVAQALGLPVRGHKARCFNGAGHRNGEDHTPSLTFYPAEARFHCFGCGAHGDAIDLVRAVRELSF